MPTLRFVHEFEDTSLDGSLSIDTDVAPPAKIRMEVDAEGGVWIRANRDGWLHLARVASELGLGTYESGYHFHKDGDFSMSMGAPEFTFSRDDTL
jgi:hypothetical protein